jgi:hypothetical protein
MILSISDVAQIKKEAAERFAEEAHFCDGLTGQSFTAERPD